MRYDMIQTITRVSRVCVPHCPTIFDFSKGMSALGKTDCMRGFRVYSWLIQIVTTGYRSYGLRPIQTHSGSQTMTQAVLSYSYTYMEKI